MSICPGTRLIAIFCLNQVGAGAFFAAVPLVLESSGGFSPREIAAFLSAEGIFSGAVFAFFGPMLLKRTSLKNALVIGLSASVATIAVPLVSDNYFALWSITILQATGFGITYFTTLAIFSENAPDGKRGWVLSVLSSLWGLTMGGGLALCGVLAGISNATCVSACLMLCAAALFISRKTSV